MSLHGAVRRVAGVVALVLVAGLLSGVSEIVGAGPADAQPTVVPFSYMGAQQTWMVPSGVTSIQVDRARRLGRRRWWGAVLADRPTVRWVWGA